MTDHLRNLTPGDPIPTSVRTWNALIDSARQYQTSRSPLPTGGPIKFASSAATIDRLVVLNLCGHLRSFRISDVVTASSSSPFELKISNAGIRRNYAWTDPPAAVSTAEWTLHIYRLAGSNSNTLRFQIYHDWKTASGSLYQRTGIFNVDATFDGLDSDDEYTVIRPMTFLTVNSQVSYGTFLVSNRPMETIAQHVFGCEVAFQHYASCADTIPTGQTRYGMPVTSWLHPMPYTPWAYIPPDPAYHKTYEGVGIGASETAIGYGAMARVMRFMHRGEYAVRIFGEYELSDDHFTFTPIEHDSDVVATIATLNVTARSVSYFALEYLLWKKTSLPLRYWNDIADAHIYMPPIILPGDVDYMPATYRTFKFDKTIPLQAGSLQFSNLYNAFYDTPVDTILRLKNTTGFDIIFHDITVEVSGALQHGGRFADEKTNLTGGVGGGSAVFSVSPTSLSASSEEDTTTDLTLNIQNVGTGTLTYQVIDNASWITLTTTSGQSTGEVDGITVTLSAVGLSAGNYSGTITVSGNATNSPVTIPVSLEVLPGFPGPP